MLGSALLLLAPKIVVTRCPFLYYYG